MEERIDKLTEQIEELEEKINDLNKEIDYLHSCFTKMNIKVVEFDILYNEQQKTNDLIINLLNQTHGSE